MRSIDFPYHNLYLLRLVELYHKYDSQDNKPVHECHSCQYPLNGENDFILCAEFDFMALIQHEKKQNNRQRGGNEPHESKPFHFP
jgi:hypothetical protein